MTLRRPPRQALWLLLALPGLLQLLLMFSAFWARFFYPYDLEWMEGGMLTHALQISDGRSLYRPPSVDFIPYLYTPLYPAAIAGFGKLFGLSYQLGRAISIVSVLVTLHIMGRALTREAPLEMRWPARVAAVCAWGLFAACYPWVECFYDLVRGDSLALAIGVGGLYALRAWAPVRASRWRGFLHERVAAAAAILALSFYAKQTGVLLVAAGGATLLVMNWRALPIYTLVAGAIGLGGSALYDSATSHWYWVYVFLMHQNHDTHMPRFWESFKHILEHFPVMTAMVGAGLLATAGHAIARRRLPAGGAGFLYWAWMFACGTLLGAVGWSTQWAVFNAFIPAMCFGAIAAGAAIVPLAACAGELAAPGRRSFSAALAAAALLALLGGQLLDARWDPRWSAPVSDGDKRVKAPPPWRIRDSVKPFVPTARDRRAGDKLIAHLATIEGDIFFPSHPWYPRLAGHQATFAHRIGVKDVTFELPCLVNPRAMSFGKGKDAVRVVFPCLPKGPPLPKEARHIAGMVEAMQAGAFAAIVLDGGEMTYDYPGMPSRYRKSEPLPPDSNPRVFSGKPTTPAAIFRPSPR